MARRQGKCERCGQKRTLLKITQVIDGEKQIWHVCENCADEIGKEEQMAKCSASIKSDFFMTIQDLIDEKLKGHKCPECGKSFDAIRDDLQFGCPRCLLEFAESFNKLFQKIHRDDHHIKTTTSQESIMGKIESYEILLDYSVRKELFEYSANYRDKIEALKKNLK